LRAIVFAALAIGLAMPATAQTAAGGENHSVILKSDGTVWSVGLNSSGQLGDSSNTQRATPVQVSSLSDVVAIAAGGNHSMAITSTGALYLWGANGNGQLGNASTTSSNYPVQSSLTDVVAIAAGRDHSVAMQSDGDIYAWGKNTDGQLGTGNTTQHTSPVLVATGGAAVAAGGYHSVFVKSNGTVYAAGANSFGQLGDASTTSPRTSAVQMSGISTAVAAAAGDYFTLILLSDGTLKGTGYNGEGSIGDGTSSNRSTPVAVSNLTGVTAIAAGFYHSMARKSDSTAYAWGWNAYGQVGDGTSAKKTTPTALSTLSSITKIGAGGDSSIAVTSTGVVYTWGRNDYKQLGNGTSTNRNTPGAISDAGYDWKVAAPTLNVATGTYNSAQNVTVSTVTPGATIHYTLNGAEPTTSDSTVVSGNSVAINISQTLKAKGFKSGMSASSTTSATYTLQVGSLGFSPNSNTFTSAQSVTIATNTSGATIRYTIDGSTPTSSSTLYTGPVSVGTTTVLKAIGLKTDWTDSAVASGTYTMNFGTLATPTADQATGSYVTSVTVALSSVSGATIRYTTNNTAVQTDSTIYTTALTFDATTTLRFKAFHPDYTPSAEVTRTYTLSPAAPVFNPTAGNYVGGQEVTVTAATAGSTIHYSITGAEPTTSDPTITSGSTLVVGNYTLKAKAVKAGNSPSSTTTAAYTISGSVTPPAIAAGKAHSLAIRNDGVAWGWGNNAFGELGIGTTTTDKVLPVVISGLNGGVAIDAGGSHSHALKDDGTLVGFGDNTNGRIGDGTTTPRYLPTAVSSLTAVVAVSSGEDHSLALKGDGSVLAWGNNTYGQIGDSTTTARTSPTAITGVNAASAVAAGDSFSVVLEQDGTISSWGRNNSGQLGNGGAGTDSTSPVSVSSISTATKIAAGFQHALALLADGTLRAWGNNSWGQIGDGYSGSSYHRSSPVEVAGLDDVIAIAAGSAFSMALKDDGTLWTWGSNSQGELGDGSTTDRSAPAQVSGLSDIVQIAAGHNHALAMTSDGTVFSWGKNADAQLGDGTTTNQLSPVQISGPGMNWRVPAPILSLASGLYSTDQSVTVTIVDPDATLRYTTTGVDPTSSDATVTSGGSIAIQQSQTLKVSGWRTGSPTSVVVARSYELKVVTPVLTPGSGAYGSSQSVSMSTTTSGTTIRYTTDGTEPTSSSTSYASAVSVPDTQTVKAKAFKSGWTTSDSGHASYWISSGTVATPSITPTGGTQTSPPLVAITTSTSGATIRYTLDGSTPTAASAVFVYPFLVNATTTVKAKAFKANYASSAVASTTYDVDASAAAATPTVVPAGGWFATQQTVTISGATGATLRYTIDGTDPTTSSTTITSGNTITVAKSQIVKVRAWASGVDPSAIRRADFVITGAVFGGVSHSAALAGNGAVWTWGSNAFNQLGQPSVTQALTPAQVLTGVAALSAGAYHTLAVKSDGSLWSWGDASNGKLGNGGATGGVTSPTQITFTDAVAVAAGYGHSLVLKADGTVFAFGKNEFGELGDGSTTQRTTAVQVVGLTGITAIAAGRDSSYALQSDGAGGGILWAWGNNHSSQLGDGSTLPRLTPVRVVGVPSATALAASTSASFAFAIGSDGKIYGWGENTLRQLGLDHSSDQVTAVALPAITAARMVTAALGAGLAVDATARTWAWGEATSSALGIGPVATGQVAVVPQRSDVGGVLSVAAGDIHTIALQPDGTMRGYGSNGSGRLGNGAASGTEVDGVTVSGLTLADNSFLAGDQDGDDLATWREYLLGTDPLNPDTNGNGVLDGHDDATGANGLDPDSDDDGVPNWVEQKNGTDPFRADTDGDNVSDANDAFPLDPTRSIAPSSNPSDTTPPVVTLKEPVSAQLIP
jgi:alpha-tubulin suppressor-like RCC1 family protein